jgi:site-specific DNA-adenine methylase
MNLSTIKIPGYETVYGGKNGSGVYQAIINNFPPHKIYIEPFLRSGAIMRLKKPAELWNIGIDIDIDVCIAWDNILSKIDLKLHYDVFNECGIEFLEHIFDRSIGYNDFVNAGLQFPEDLLIYCDPPYLIETRSTPKGVYKHEFTIEHHIRLLKAINELPFCIAISCYDNDLYSTMLSGWRKITYKTQTRSGTVIETLYMNYPKPLQLHDYHFLGNDFRQRERIRQKIKRHVNRLKRLPSYEMQAIIEAIKTKI